MTASPEVNAATGRRVTTLREVAARAPDLPTDRWVDAVAMLVADSVLDASPEPLTAFLDEASRMTAVPRIDRPSVEALAAVSRWALERMRPAAAGRSLGPGEVRILRFVADHPQCSSSDLVAALDLVEETVSRLGARLERDGLVLRVRAGRYLRWRLPEAGRQALSAAAPALVVTADMRATLGAHTAQLLARRAAIAADPDDDGLSAPGEPVPGPAVHRG
jgi:DNA-binding MarR family transcriptional regulator